MRLPFTTFLILTLAVLTACQTASPGPVDSVPDVAKSDPAPPLQGIPAESAQTAVDEHGSEDDAPRIALSDAKKAFDNGEAVFVDTRSESSYITERIKGSINIPMESFQQRVKEVPQGKKIIAYCS